MSGNRSSPNPLAQAMSERDLQESVRALATGFGLCYFHDHDARQNYSGLPDVIAVGPGGVLWRELKSETGTLTPAQRKWRDALQAGGADWDLWRPSDLLDGTVASALDKLRKPREEAA